jgi:hypothetical protein
VEEIRFETERQALEQSIGPAALARLSRLAREAGGVWHLPRDFEAPPRPGERRIRFGALGAGVCFRIPGERWIPRERHLAGWGARLEPVREVLCVRREASGPHIVTSEPGVVLAFDADTEVDLTQLAAGRFPPSDWLADRPWVAPTLRRLAREDRAGMRVMPALACRTCEGTGRESDAGVTAVCSRCGGLRLDPELVASAA